MILESYNLLIIAAIWFLLVITKRVVTKKGDIDVLLFFIVATAFVIFDILELYAVDFTILSSALYFGFAMTLLFFVPRDLSKKDNSKIKIKALKKELKQLTTSSESLRKRFIAIIELQKDGVIFRSDDGNMFITEPCKNMIEATSNEFAQLDYEKQIHHDDIHGFQKLLAKLNKKHPHYETTYRYNVGNGYIWVKERGYIVYYEDRSMIISTMKSLDVKRYPETEVEMLNNLPIDHAFLEALQSLNRVKKPYHIIFFELSTIPKVNEKYGRDIGDLMMGEFLNKLRYNFVKDEQSIFRLTGIRFAMIIKDERKYNILERALSHGGELLNFEMTFGNVSQSIFPHFGIQKITMFEEPLDEIVKRTHKALDIAINDETTENYFIIGG